MRIGIDLGGTKTEIIALADSGAEIYRHRIATEKDSYPSLIAMLVRLVEEAEQKLGQKGSVGLGLPGTLSARTGKVKNANTVILNGNAINADLEQALGRSVRCMNDANCLAISEATDGAGKGHKLVFAAIIGTGCGSGIAIDGQAWAGVNLVAGEWGHNPLPWMTPDEYVGETACWCGQKNCLETWISGTGFEQDYERHAVKKRGSEIIAAARAGEDAAQQALQRYASRLARALAQTINVMDPDVIVLGGGMSNVAELYDMVPPLLPKYVFGGEVSTPIVKSFHGDSSGVRGAAWLWPSKN